MSDGRTWVYTIAACNYLPQARVLMASVKAQHPGWERVLLLADPPLGRFDPSLEDFKVLQAEDLRLPGGGRFIEAYSCLEACTALKPFMARWIFDQGAAQVFFLDPDIQLFAPMAEAEALLQGALMVLTPHRLGACESMAWERTFLAAGAFNLGFITLARHPGLEDFLAWWERCLATDCLLSQGGYLFVDQRWMDQAPARFEGVRVLRHPGYNVAYWCLEERALHRTAGGLRCQNEPLVFFHFSGFSSAPPQLSQHLPSYAMPQGSAVESIAASYRSALDASGWEAARAWPWGRPGPGRLKAGWNPMLRLWNARPDMQGVYPEPRGKDRWRAWGWYLAQSFPGLEPWVERVRRLRRFVLWRMKRVRSIPDPAQRQPGADLVGYFRVETGMGEAARLGALALQKAQVPFALIDLSHVVPAAKQVSDWNARFRPRALHRASIFYVNGSEMPHLQRQLPGAGLFSGQYSIGLWHWELPVLAATEAAGLPWVQELWAPSRFIYEALAAATDKPVKLMPHGILVDPDPGLGRDFFQLPQDCLVIGCFFDAFSFQERKNPEAAILAFQKAFDPEDQGVLLVVKANHSAGRPEAYQRLQALAQGWPNIRFLEPSLSRSATHALIRACDAILSLHRSEGYGLVPAEAMALGRVAIATAWSGNLDFMDPEASCLVDCRLVPVGRSVGPYEGWQQWAEPDLDQAAAYLRRLKEEPAWARDLGSKAARHMAEKHSVGVAARRMAERLSQLGLL